MRPVLLILILLLVPGVIASIEDYRYYRLVDVGGIREPSYIMLDSSILDYSSSDGQDIRIYSGKTEVPYHIYYQQQLTDLPIDEVSATSEQPPYRGTTYSAINMIDNSYTTYYQNDFEQESQTTTITFKLKTEEKLESISFSFTGAAPSSMDAYAILEGTLKPVNSVTNTNSISLNSIKTNTVSVRITHSGTVKITQARITGYSFGKLLFKPTSDDVKLYYGRANDIRPAYDTQDLSTTASTPTLRISAQKINALFKGEQDSGVYDNCPNIDNPDQTDSDKDGVGDACDNCQYVKNTQRDTDNDGVGDECDNCPYKFNPDQLDMDLAGKGWVCSDKDKDGITNDIDNCLAGYNPNQQDVDRDGIGDVCEDDDADGIENYRDKCKLINDPENKDSDNDNIGDSCDNCPKISNMNQKDTDEDGIGDVCEDDDQDGFPNPSDNCPSVYNSDQIDWDRDRKGDACDNCPEISNADQQDIDRDGIGDVCDDEESRALANPNIAWAILIVASLGILIFAFSIRTKKP